MNTLTNNKYLRIGVLLLTVEVLLQHPLQIALLALVAAVIYLSDENDLKLIEDLKSSLTKLDFSKLNQLLLNKSSVLTERAKYELVNEHVQEDVELRLHEGKDLSEMKEPKSKGFKPTN